MIAAIVPARDEESTVAATVTALRSLAEVDRVIVVDDSSSDGTVRVASLAGAEVMRLLRHEGKGAALESGLDALGDSADIVLFIDADLGGTAAEAARLLGPVIAGDVDMTVAALPKPAGKAGLGLVKRLARWGIARLGGGFEARAPLSGQRALDASALRAVRPLGGGFGVEVAMSVRALRAGLRVAEVDTAMAHRATGRDLAGFAHRGRQFAHVATTLAHLAFERPRS